MEGEDIPDSWFALSASSEPGSPPKVVAEGSLGTCRVLKWPVLLVLEAENRESCEDQVDICFGAIPIGLTRLHAISSGDSSKLESRELNLALIGAVEDLPLLRSFTICGFCCEVLLPR